MRDCYCVFAGCACDRAGTATPPLSLSHFSRVRFLCRPLILLVLLTLQGCGFATLDHMLAKRNGDWVQSGGQVSVVRDNKTVDAGPGSLLKKDDVIETASDTSATLGFLLAGEIILRPSTRIKILNPSLYTYFGELFVKVKGAFDIHYEYGTAGSKGTEYVVKVEPGRQVTVSVLEGRVELTSKSGSWQPIQLAARQRAQLSGTRTPATSHMHQGEFNDTIEWINRVQSATGREDVSIIVPDVDGMTRQEAVARIENEHLRLGAVQRRLTGQSPVGSVLRQTPVANSRAAIGSSVDIEIEAEPTRVPDVRGLTPQGAKRRLDKRRLHLGQVEQILSEGRTGTIARQNPTAGSTVMTDSPVDVVVVADSAIVPHLQGASLAGAQQRLASRRLRIGNVDYRITGSATPDQVLSQHPPAGERVHAQSEVTLVVEAESVLIPNLVGQARSQAQQILNAQGLSMGQVDSRRVAHTQPGTVLDQSPPANTRVAPGARVDVGVAAEVITVPSVVGSPYQSAAQLLQSSRLRPGRVDNRLDDRYAAGTVIEQHPSAGTLVDPQSAVSLVVAEAGVRVPGVTNQTLQQAINQLSSAGLGYSTSDQQTDHYSPNTVIAQSLSPGMLVRKGTRVHLTVARAIPRCIVPNTIGSGYQQAAGTLQRAGFGFYVQGPSDSAAYVTGQNPSSGHAAQCGSTVTLFTQSIEQQPSSPPVSPPVMKPVDVYKPIDPSILVPRYPVIK